MPWQPLTRREKDGHEEAERDAGDGEDEEEEEEEGAVRLFQRGQRGGAQTPARLQQARDEQDGDEDEGQRLDEPGRPMEPVGQAHHLHRLFEAALLFVDDALDDVERRVDEAEHDDERQPALQRHQELVVGVRRVRQPPHLDVDVVRVLARQRFRQHAAHAVLQRQEAFLVVT